MGEVISINAARYERMQRRLASQSKYATIETSEVEQGIVRIRSSLKRIAKLMEELRCLNSADHSQSGS